MVTTRPQRRLTLEVLPDLRELAGVREQVRTWLADDEVTTPQREDLALVVTELCTNAIEATTPGTPVSVALTNDGTVLRLTVRNHAGVEPGAPGSSFRRGSLQERGRGLAIVQALSDRVTMSTEGDQTVVRTMRLL